MKFSAADMQFMRTAMELAERDQFTVAPPPSLGVSLSVLTAES